MTNSADPDQLASSDANWSGSTLFAKAVYILASRLELLKQQILILKKFFYHHKFHF